MTKKDPLKERIEEYLKDSKVAEAIVDSADLIMRLRLGQLNTFADIIKKYCSIHQEGRGVDLNEPLYRAVELGELLKCYSKRGKCNEAAGCWITRKGFCPKKNKPKRKTRDNKRKKETF